MRRLSNWFVSFGTLAFVALPLVAAGCAENQSSAPPASSQTVEDSTDLDELDALSEELGAPMEAGSGLGFPESGSGLGLPESGSTLDLPESGSSVE